MNRKVLSLILGLSFVVGCLAQTLPVLDSCIVCTSFNNTACATDPDSLPRSPCNPTSQGQLIGCYTRIVDGFTVRGCASELDEVTLSECNNAERCDTCIGVSFTPVFGCNNRIFPEHRRQCHKCQDGLNSTCDGIPLGLPTVCDIFHPTDRCYIHRTVNTITRGCMSDMRTLCANENDCHICEISGCNNLRGDLIPTAPGSAVTNKISIVMLSTTIFFAFAKFL